MAGERIPITREQMSPGRKIVDTAATGGNIVEGIIVVGGALVAPVVGGLALGSLLLGREFQQEVIRKAPVEKVVYQAKKRETQKQFALAA